MNDIKSLNTGDSEARSFPARTESLYEAQSFIESALENAGCAMRDINKVSIAFEELFVNVAHYAYEGEEGSIDVGFSCRDNRAVITLADSGKAFNPLEREKPDVSESAETRVPGGLGIYMAEKMMDSFTYRREAGRNIVTVTKNIGKLPN